MFNDCSEPKGWKRLKATRRAWVLLPFATALAVVTNMASFGRAQGGAGHPLAGVWSVTKGPDGGDASQPGLFIFTDRHYSAVYSVEDERRPHSKTPFSPSRDEKAAQYDSIIVNTGTYETSDASVTMRPMIAKSPEFVGGNTTMGYKIDGDVLTLTTMSIVSADGASPPDVAATTMTLRRIE
ncbi:MAG TPA: lipocalin-like domain-containing protein [Vicinamibacteria bacterium]|nr:lipocalin-like domain-containing protein [Vicinamibacteria bacterium]